MRKIIKFSRDIRISAYSSVGGYEEKHGPLGEKFDFCDESDKFGQRTWELAEAEMGRISLNIALNKASLSHEDIDLLVAGDLQNQCTSSSLGMSLFGIPFLGVYGACSTCTESIGILSCVMEASDDIKYGAATTTSHNSAAERQFRTPIEYGGQRAPSAQWTSTAAGSFILGECGNIRISEFMPGKIISGATSDGSNMGAAMSFAAADSIKRYFDETGLPPSHFDYIVTGDLGKVGSSLLRDILSKDIHGFERFHTDCGLLLYDFKEKDAHSGASGCGTSASVLSSHFLPLLEKGDIKRILFLSTGALMNPTSLLQGEDIYGIAPLLKIERI
jgi:stage V sporulation protein AD